MKDLALLDAHEVARRLSVTAAADAIEAALSAGLDPEADPPRGNLAVGSGDLLVMPSTTATHATVKLVTVGGDPRIQGLCVVFDAGTLAPVAVIDGVALTNLRTPAVSVVAARRLAAPDASRLVVFGRGPQARAHADALAAIRPIRETTMFGSDAQPGEIDDAVRQADVICCATTAREPLFDGSKVRDGAFVIAIGSHEPDAREVDDQLVMRATVVVESRTSAMREAGDVIAAGLRPDRLVTLAELVTGPEVPAGRPRLFKSTGMSWEDAVVASALAPRGFGGERA